MLTKTILQCRVDNINRILSSQNKQWQLSLDFSIEGMVVAIRKSKDSQGREYEDAVSVPMTIKQMGEWLSAFMMAIGWQ